MIHIQVLCCCPTSPLDFIHFSSFFFFRPALQAQTFQLFFLQVYRIFLWPVQYCPSQAADQKTRKLQTLIPPMKASRTNSKTRNCTDLIQEPWKTVQDLQQPSEYPIKMSEASDYGWTLTTKHLWTQASWFYLLPDAFTRGACCFSLPEIQIR